MTYTAPERLFHENGGGTLLEAYGLRAGNSPLATFFSTKLPAAPKPGAAPEAGKLSQPVPLGQLALVVAWQGGMRLYCNVAAPREIPGVTFNRCVHVSQFPLVAHEAMDLPRPLLFLGVGPSYPGDLAAARLTIDPDTVEAFGSGGFVLSRASVGAILDASARSGIPVAKLRRAAMTLERAVAGEDSLGSDKSRKAALSLVGLKAQDPDAEARLDDHWRMVDDLPLTSDPAWKVAEHVAGAPGEKESEAAA